MFQDIQTAISQLNDRKFRSVLLRSIGLTIILLIANYVGFTYLLDWLIPETITLPYFGEITWLSDGLSYGAPIVIVLLSAFLMFPVASVFIGFFLDDIADAVEGEHYPHLPQAPRVPWFEALIDAIKFMIILVLANFVALLIYLFVPLLAPVIFWIVNGHLLGREYFQLVAARRLGATEATKLRKRHSGVIWLTGILMAIPLSIPIINLIVPILGVATFTHQFHRLTRNS